MWCGCKAGIVTCNCPVWCHLCFCQPGSLAGGGAGWSTDLQSAKSIPAGVRCHCRASRQLGLLTWGLFKWGQQPGTNMGNGTWTMLLVGRHKWLQRCCDHWSMVVEMRPCCNAGRMETSHARTRLHPSLAPALVTWQPADKNPPGTRSRHQTRLWLYPGSRTLQT